MVVKATAPYKQAGLSSKPIIDILIEVRNLLQVDKKNNEMIKIGYKPLGEYGIKNRRFFHKGDDNRTHHIHIFKQKDQNIIRHLAFRDYLRHNKKKMKEYESLKIKLTKNYSDDIDMYCKKKNILIKNF